MHPAAHSGGVVAHDASHHATSDGGWIRTEISAISGKAAVHFPPDDSRLERNGMVFRVITGLFPVLSCDKEHAVRYRLPGKGRPRSPEGYVDSVSACQGKDSGHFILILCPQYRLGDKPVLPRIRSPCKRAQFISIDSVLGQKGLYALNERFVFIHTSNLGFANNLNLVQI